MLEEKLIDDLIEAGWYVLDTNFDETAFRNWRERALYCLAGLLGQDHHYTESFRSWVQGHEKNNVLTGGGILSAVKEEILKGRKTDNLDVNSSASVSVVKEEMAGIEERLQKSAQAWYSVS